MSGTTAFWHVEDIEAIVKAVLDAGGTMQQEINEVGNGRWGRHGSVRPCHGYGRSIVQSVGPSSGSEISSITSKPNRW